MRSTMLIAPLLILATPALAQPAAQPMAVPPEMQQVMADPATVDRLTNAMQAMSRAFLDLPVGSIEAALDGRKPTSADRRRTVRSETGMNERQLDARIAAGRPLMQQSMRALSQALPSMIQGLGQAQQSLERAVSNMPDPTYPRQ